MSLQVGQVLVVVLLLLTDNGVIQQRKMMMTYAVITSNGKEYKFFIRAAADTYALAFGGIVKAI